MGYEFDGFVAAIATWKAWEKEIPGLRICSLPFDLGLAPGTTVAGSGADTHACGVRLSEKGLVAFISASEFGDAGGSSAILFRAGSASDVPVGEALRLLGVRAREGDDEFDTLGLGRNTRRWIERASAEQRDETQQPTESVETKAEVVVPIATGPGPSEEDHLDTMFERGEISAERYEERMRALKGTPPGGVLGFFRRFLGL